MWKNLETWKAAVKEGVKEFSQAAISEVATTVAEGGKVVLDVAKPTKSDINNRGASAGQTTQASKQQSQEAPPRTGIYAHINDSTNDLQPVLRPQQALAADGHPNMSGAVSQPLGNGEQEAGASSSTSQASPPQTRRTPVRKPTSTRLADPAHSPAKSTMPKQAGAAPVAAPAQQQQQQQQQAASTTTSTSAGQQQTAPPSNRNELQQGLQQHSREASTHSAVSVVDTSSIAAVETADISSLSTPATAPASKEPINAVKAASAHAAVDDTTSPPVDVTLKQAAAPRNAVQAVSEGAVATASLVTSTETKDLAVLPVQQPVAGSGVSASAPEPAVKKLMEANVQLSVQLDTALQEIEHRKSAFDELRQGYETMQRLLEASMSQTTQADTAAASQLGALESAHNEAANLRTALAATKQQLDAAMASEASAMQEVEDARSALADARKEAAAARKAEARAKHEADAAREEKERVEAAAVARSQVRDMVELEEMRLQLAAAVRSVASAADAKDAAEERAAAAEVARVAAEAARQEAERLRREAQAEAQAAHVAAEAERNERAEAQGLSESLRLDSQRRARVFNNAVKAAVARLQRELEGERDSLQARLDSLQQLLDEARVELQQTTAEAAAAAEDAQHLKAAAEAAQRLADAEQQAAERARSNEAKAVMAARAAEEARSQLQVESSRMEAELTSVSSQAEAAHRRLSELEAELSELKQTEGMRADELQRELQDRQGRLDTVLAALRAAEQKLEQASNTGRDAVETTSTEVRQLRSRVEELDAELTKLRQPSKPTSLFTLPTKEEVLAGLGLEASGDNKLKWKVDVEATAPIVRLEPRGLKLTSGAASKRGEIPLRMWLLIAYLTVLHIAVMVSFTRNYDINALCAHERAAVTPQLRAPSHT